jgi:hypothetical protein
VFILSDHQSEGDCSTIIRIEHSNMSELTDLFAILVEK